MRLCLLLLIGLAAVPVRAQLHVLPTESVSIHPPLAPTFQCAEHPMGAEDHVVDALGTDCTVARSEGSAFPSLYVGDGARNEDWHIWREPVLAPFDGVVALVGQNETVNTPGTWGEGRAAAVLVRRLDEDGGRPVHVALVHLREIDVAQGDTVRAGQPVGRVGNNGIARFPHLHVGAFRGDLAAAMSGGATALQVRFDLEAMGRVRGTLNDGTTRADVLPASFEHGRVFVLPVTVSGDTLRLFTDTGGGPVSFVAPHVADRLALETEEVTQQGQTGEITTLPDFRPGRSIPPTPAYGDSPMLAFLAGRVAVRPISDHADYDGMLGQSWHRDRVWTFDYARGRLLLHPTAEGLAFDPSHTVPLGFQTDSTGQRTQHFPSVEATVDGQTFRWLLDTGATLRLTDRARQAVGGPETRAVSFVTARTFDRWRARHPDWPVTEGADANVGGEPIITVPEVTIAGHAVGPVLFVRRADENYDEYMSQWMDRPIEGALGGSLFEHFVLTVDYPGAQAHFERIE